MGQTYLITGGAGNLACQLTFALADDAERTILFDLAEMPVADTAPGCEYIQGDITQADTLRRLLLDRRPSVVIHLASLLSASCEQDRPRAWQVNMDATFALFEAALEAGTGQVFFASSLGSYGGKLPDPLPEDYPQWPGSLYGVTKAACERLGVCYHVRHGIDFRCVRLPLVISRYAPAGAASAYASRAFVEAVESRRFVFPVNPTTRVSSVYVRDAITSMVALMRAPAERLSRRVYNIHALAPTAVEIADAIARRMNGVELRFAPKPELVRLIESWPAVIVDTSARKDWGWQPAYDLERLADDLLRQLTR